MPPFEEQNPEEFELPEQGNPFIELVMDRVREFISEREETLMGRILTRVQELIPPKQDVRSEARAEIKKEIEKLPKPEKPKEITPERIKSKITELPVKDRWLDWGHLKNIPAEIFKKSDGDGGWVGGFGKQDFNLSSDTKSELTANVDDYDVRYGSFIRLSSDASRTITGLEGGEDGRAILLANVGSNDIVLANQSASSGGINRIITGSGSDLTLSSNDVVVLVYDSTTERWRVQNADTASISDESVQDIVGAMVTGNTESGLSVTYQDADGTLDFEVDGVLQDLDTLGAPSTDGEFIVATGAGAFAYESGATARTSLGLAIGTDVQAFDAVLEDLAALSAVADNEFIVGTGAGTYAHESGATARTSLGLGSAAVVDTDLADLNEATIEAAIDTLANLTSVQGLTVTLADAGANAIFGWDDTASAYENLTAAEVRAVINVEDGADVTDTANVTDAGALMDSEVDADLKTFALPANTTISAFGATLVDDADAGTARATLGVDEFSKSITIEDPTDSEDISMFFTNKAITVTEMRAVLVGSSTPSVTWTIRHGTDRNATGAEVVTSGTTTTSTTTGSDVTSFNDATIVADSFVWLESTASSGTVDELHITIIYTID